MMKFRWAYQSLTRLSRNSILSGGVFLSHLVVR